MPTLCGFLIVGLNLKKKLKIEALIVIAMIFNTINSMYFLEFFSSMLLSHMLASKLSPQQRGEVVI